MWRAVYVCVHCCCSCCFFNYLHILHGECIFSCLYYFLPVVVGSCFCSCVCIIFHLTERVYMRACVHVCALWVSVFMCFVYIFVVGSFWHKMKKKISLFLSPTTSQRRRRVAATPPIDSAINSPQQRCAATTRPGSPCCVVLRCCCCCCSACSQSCLQILSLQ